MKLISSLFLNPLPHHKKYLCGNLFNANEILTETGLEQSNLMHLWTQFSESTNCWFLTLLHRLPFMVSCSGYCPPEFIEQNYVSNKFDIFSLGVVMIKIIAGSEGYRKTAEMHSQEFIYHVSRVPYIKISGYILYICKPQVIFCNV
jgi:serine/threonine protein kinase